MLRLRAGSDHPAQQRRPRDGQLGEPIPLGVDVLHNSDGTAHWCNDPPTPEPRGTYFWDSEFPGFDGTLDDESEADT